MLSVLSAAGRGILFWTLFPFVIPQAIGVRRNAPRLSAADGPTEGNVGSGRQLRLCAIGDSVIAGVGAETLSDALPGQVALEISRTMQCEILWEAYGRIGATSSTVSRRLVPTLPSWPFDFMVVSVGVNDVTTIRSVRTWSNDLQLLIRQLLDHSPGAIIALVGLPPLSSFPLLPQPLRAVMGMRARMLDEVAKSRVGPLKRVVHVPIEIDPSPEQFSSDGFHPSPVSYKELGRQVAAAIISVKP